MGGGGRIRYEKRCSPRQRIEGRRKIVNCQGLALEPSLAEPFRGE